MTDLNSVLITANKEKKKVTLKKESVHSLDCIETIGSCPKCISWANNPAPQNIDTLQSRNLHTIT